MWCSQMNSCKNVNISSEITFEQVKQEKIKMNLTQGYKDKFYFLEED